MKMDVEIPAAVAGEVLTYRSDQLVISEMTFKVPLDYSGDHSDTITLFARAVVQSDRPVAEKDGALNRPQKPWLVYLEGGPGFGIADPSTHPIVGRMKDYRYLFIDYRGTGVSHTVTADTLRGETDEEKAAYLRLFRQDNIVRDLEAVRKNLLKDSPVTANKQWSLFGQSFGGFVTLTYLSMYPESIREAFLTGGLAPIGESADTVYTSTYARAVERNQAFYKKFPGDASKIIDICNFIQNNPDKCKLPSSGILTVKRFLTMGIAFGQHSGINRIHRLITRAHHDLQTWGKFTGPTLNTMESETQFDHNIIYAILHEAIYCDGPGSISNWAASRMSATQRGFEWVTAEEFSGFSADSPPFFSGEMIFPSHFDTNPGLIPLKNVADQLAKYDKWEHIYDLAKLAKNKVPIYAASYVDDLYVDNRLARNTAFKVGNCSVYETNALYHNALRAKPDVVIEALLRLKFSTLD